MLTRLKWFTSRITLAATYRLLSMDVLLGHDPKMGKGWILGLVVL